MISATTFTGSGLMKKCSIRAPISRTPSATLEEAQTRQDGPCLQKADAQARGNGRGSRVRMGDPCACTWPGITASRSRPIIFLISRSSAPVNGRRRKGWTTAVEFVEDDYRNISGRFDVFVSIGMLEHVGTRYYRELGKIIGRSLKENGRGLIHSIGRNKAEPMNPWIERHIFPGSYMPTLREMMEIFEPSGFSILDVENLRLHYAKTLRALAGQDLNRRRTGSARCTIRSSYGPGGSISPGPLRPLLPGTFSSSRWSLRVRTRTTCPGHGPRLYAETGRSRREHGLL